MAETLSRSVNVGIVALSNQLRETLGRDAAEDLVTWLVEERLQHEALRSEMVGLREEMRAGFARMDTASAKLEAGVSTRIADVKADLMKWSFVFWVGAVAAIAMLAGVVP